MLVAARWVLPVSSAPIEDGAVVIRSGRLRAVGPRRLLAAEHPEEKVLDLGRAVLLPGFVNAHAHLELTLLRGLLPGLPYYPWIRRLVELKSDGLRPSEHVFYALLGAAEMIRAGITCVADCTDSGAPFDALAVSGLRGRIYQEVFAPAESFVDMAMSHLAERLDGLLAMASDRVDVGVSPHSPYMACPELLERTALLCADRRLPLSLHLAEAEDEVLFVRDGKGPIAEHHAKRGWPVTARGCSPAVHVGHAGWLALPVHVQFVHLVRASATDLDLLRDARAAGHAIGVALCPRSNANLGNGLPDAAALDTRTIPWGFGTDGAPAVGACDLFAEMRSYLHARRAVAGDPAAASPSMLLRAATLGAAESLGLGSQIGSLEVGKQADLVAVNVDHPKCDPVADPALTLVECCGPGDVRLTMVAGEVLFDGTHVLTIDEPRVRARCRERAEILVSSLGGRRRE